MKQGAMPGMDSQTRENLDDPGLDASGSCFVKKGTPSGEEASFNYLPPGPDITNQKNAEFNAMPFRKLTSMSYPGDGAFPVRDIAE